MTTRCIMMDFETISQCDLLACGAWRYSEDISTAILCLSWREIYPDGSLSRKFSWRPDVDYDVPYALCELLDYRGAVLFIAQSCAFEKAIWRNIVMPFYGMPDIPNERWHDTQAVLACKVLPLNLEQACAVLQIGGGKDMLGNKLTIGLSRLNKKTGMLPERTEDVMRRVVQYCDSDVEEQIRLHQCIGFLPPGERAVWLMDQEINERGVRLDMDYVRACQEIVAQTIPGQVARFREITGINPTQGAKYLDWLGDNGLWIPNLKKETMTALLGDPDAAPEELDEAPDFLDVEMSDLVRESLELRREVMSTSIAKLGAMTDCVCADGRARGLLQYHGAGPGRWAGRLLQPQNFPRGTIQIGSEAPDPQMVVDAIMTGDAEYVRTVFSASPIRVVSGGLRHAIIPDEGNLLVVGDYAGIEARIVLALAGQHDRTALMASGADVYCDMAALIYQRPINKKNDPEERQIGKNTVLGCCFGLGYKTFWWKYCRHLPIDFCKTVIDAYRTKWAPKVPALWAALQEAANQTAWTGLPHCAFGVTYAMEDRGGHRWMTALLPSGRKLWYFNPQPGLHAMPWSTKEQPDIRRSWTYQTRKNGKWLTVKAYGGLLTENVVQGLARDLLVFAMKTCQKAGIKVVLTVHDELVTEMPISIAASAILKKIMETRPPWAIDMQVPVSVEVHEPMGRYKK